MSGKKGMKWREKPEKRVQVYSSVSRETFDKMEKLKNDLIKSRSEVVNNLIVLGLSYYK